MPPLTSRSSKPSTLKLECFTGSVGYFFSCRCHYHHQQLFMNIDSCYLIRHTFLSAEEAAERTTNNDYAPLRAHGPSSRRGHVTFIGSKRAIRIILPDGLNTSRAARTSPVPRLRPAYRCRTRFSSLWVGRRPMDTPLRSRFVSVPFVACLALVRMHVADSVENPHACAGFGAIGLRITV